jgi:sugar (pentulose or hexulose) kinase
MSAHPRHIAVIDIGKTNAKLALVDLASLTEIAVTTTPNRVLQGPPWPHFDADALWSFILTSLRDLHAAHRIDAIAVTTHGASAALVSGDGSLAAPILDYEHPGPDETAVVYDAIRPPFADTGSPRLPMGLNLGAQLHWQSLTDPGLTARTAHVLPLPQYWAFRLTGVASADLTSLGCHTDLWSPAARSFSSLRNRLPLAALIPGPRLPRDVLGLVLPAIAAATGLDSATPVLCGIHDSNASLLPHLLARKPPFAVVSTGTWVICMAIGGAPTTLDPARDSLMNVNALGDPVPSARFMGGREFDLIRNGSTTIPSPADITAVLSRSTMLMPAVEPRSGPFPGRSHHWTTDGAALPEGQRMAALSFYLALMTAECLAITGAAGPAIVEGPFARNQAYLAMLASATARPVVPSPGSTGTSLGAALLFGGDLTRAGLHADEAAVLPVAALVPYAERWQRAVSPPGRSGSP